MNSNIKIIVDMDDTIIWLLPVWVNWLNQKYNLSVNWEEIKEWDMSLTFPQLTKSQIYEPLTTEEIWDEVVPRGGAVEALYKLHKSGYDIYICTATDYRNVKPKFERVIERYFPFIDWKHIIVTSNKQMIYADFIIDDAPQNLIGGCQKHQILIDAPHNKDVSVSQFGIHRMERWDRIYFYIQYVTARDRAMATSRVV